MRPSLGREFMAASHVSYQMNHPMINQDPSYYSDREIVPALWWRRGRPSEFVEVIFPDSRMPVEAWSRKQILRSYFLEASQRARRRISPLELLSHAMRASDADLVRGVIELHAGERMDEC